MRWHWPKFSHALRSPLTTHLCTCSYSALKKYIFQLEKQVHDSNETGDLEANERSRLMANERGETSMNTRAADRFFAGLLDKELEKIVKFYIETEADVAKDIETLEADIAQKDAEGPSPAGSEYDEDDDDEDDEEDEDAKLRRRKSEYSLEQRRPLTPFAACVTHVRESCASWWC